MSNCRIPIPLSDQILELSRIFTEERSKKLGARLDDADKNHRSLQVLEFFQREENSKQIFGTTEVARQLHINARKASSACRRLEEKNLLEFVGQQRDRNLTINLYRLRNN